MSVLRHVVFVSTESSLSARLSSAFDGFGSGWKLHSAASEAGVHDKIDEGRCGVLMVDSSIEREAALGLMDKVWQVHPEVIRFFCHTHPDDELMMRCAWNCHRLFTQELEPTPILDAIQRAVQVQGWLEKRSIQQMVSRLRTFPTIPTLYFRVLKELESPNTCVETLAGLIKSDMAISTKIIQIVNSALYARQRKISDLREALQHLGLNNLKSLVLAIQAVARLDKIKPLYFSADKIWRHGLAVAHLARNIAERESDDPSIADDAYMAGLLHDIGKLVLASNLEEQYHGVVTLARQQRVPVVTVEMETFGVNHGEVAAYLVALWGLPERIVEAIALHHSPGRSEDSKFSPLTAVHIANCIAHEESPDKEVTCPSVLDACYVERLGLTDRIDTWRSKPKGGTKPVAASTREERPLEVVNQAQPDRSRKVSSAEVWRWCAYGTAVAAAVAAVWWVFSRILVHARVAAPPPAEEVLVFPAASPLVSHEDQPLISTATSFSTPQTSIPPVVSNSSSVARGNGPVEPAASTTAPSTNAAAPAAASSKSYTLEAIFQRPQKSAAMINGRPVFAGDKVDGATVLSIGTNEVRLNVDGSERVLKMR